MFLDKKTMQRLAQIKRLILATQKERSSAEYF